jgi:hypothetical protein
VEANASAAASLRRPPVLPDARGPLTEALLDALRHEPGRIRRPDTVASDFLHDDDAQLALSVCYELHYQSFAGVDSGWEWAPDLLALRAALEDCFARRLTDVIGPPPTASPVDAHDELQALAAGDGGPSLSQFMAERGELRHMREFCVHRSSYQLKEADPHTWMIPRLNGRAKAAAVAIQYDEYGAGAAGEMHAALFAETMRALDLDDTYGAYLDRLPGSTLATGNLVTMFGLHRRWRAACVGHLALFEMTSVGPMGRYAYALERLGVSRSARRFYDVHVAADAWHERIAQEELVAGLLEAEPGEAGRVIFGARALAEVERRMATRLLDAWAVDATSLRAPLPEAGVPTRDAPSTLACSAGEHRA